MGAKRRMPVKTVLQSKQEREVERLLEVLSILDGANRAQAPLTQAQEQRHRVLAKEYIQLRDQFSDARELVLTMARAGHWGQISGQVYEMDRLKRLYDGKREELESFRKELGS